MLFSQYAICAANIIKMIFSYAYKIALLWYIFEICNLLQLLSMTEVELRADIDNVMPERAELGVRKPACLWTKRDVLLLVHAMYATYVIGPWHGSLSQCIEGTHKHRSWVTVSLSLRSSILKYINIYKLLNILTIIWHCHSHWVFIALICWCINISSHEGIVPRTSYHGT